MRTGFDQNFILKYSWIATVLYFIEYPLIHSETLTSIIWIPAVFFSLLYCVLNINLIGQNNVLKAAAVLLICLTSMIFGGTLFEKSRYVSLICFFNNIFSICIFSKVKISRSTIIFIKRSVIILSLLFIIYYQTPIANRAYNTKTGEMWICTFLVFNLDNSNATGMFLYLLFSVLLIFAFEERKKIKKLLLIALLICDAFFIYGTGARSCMVAAVATLLIAILSKFIKKIPKPVIWACMAFPLVFAFGLVSLYNSGFHNIHILGKSLYTGRETMYVLFLNSLDAFWNKIFGDFSQYGFPNAHNAPISVYLGAGIIGVFVLYNIYYQNICRISTGKSSMTRAKLICIACILGMFIQSSAEAALFLGGFPAVCFVGTIFAIASTDSDNSFSMMLMN